MQQIKDEKYQVSYDSSNATIILDGSLLLNGASAYAPILDLLKQAAKEQAPKQLTIDIRGLKFLNSSGINMMTKFVMYVSDVEALELELIFVAWQHVAWQEKLVINLARLMPSLQSKLEQT
jgi:hypothetical protein